MEEASEAVRRMTTLQKRLLAWFQAQGRALPWRGTRDPYAVLVSEVMLQQTQVERVVPKYRAFLERFPTLAALAEAPTADVIRAWAGMGYNRRALHLQRAARAAVEQHGGRLPDELPALRRLDGIGPYTAAAVACFAFSQQLPVLDTNVKRVLGRVFGGGQGLAGSALAQAAQDALPQGHAWEWNQALMDLGATICRAGSPRCTKCPVRAHCRAAPLLQEAGRVAEPSAVYRTRSAPFQGSPRYYRGRIVTRLREAASGAGMEAAALGGLVKADFASEELPWLLELLAGLERDGLVSLKREAGRVSVALPQG